MRVKPLKTLKNKNIWVIGASSGIGEALAHTLSKKGANVIISARSEDKLNTVLKNLTGDTHLALPLDVVNLDALANAVETIKNKYATLDSVIFLPAIYVPHKSGKPDIAFVHKALSVNIGGAYNMIDKVQPFMEEQKHGQIVICASVAGYRGLPNGQPYCSTKAALVSLGESLKVELEPKNIDVKIISPGFVKTQLTDKNEFTMPMIITPEIAAQEIAKGLTKKTFEIHFPKKFTFIMKTLRILPAPLFFMLSRKMLKEQK